MMRSVRKMQSCGSGWQEQRNFISWALFSWYGFGEWVTLGGSFTWWEDEQSAETVTAENHPFWTPQRAWPFNPGWAQAWGPGFVMGTSLLLVLAAPQQIEEGGRPPNTYLREADGEENVWDAFTSPSGGAQQESTKPAAPKSDFHTSSHPRMPYPRGRRK